MADGTNLQLPTVVGDKYDTEDLGVRGKVARSKLMLGALDVDGGDVATANPFPVRLSDGAVLYNTVAAAQVPSALGQAAAAASLSVVIASDQSALPISDGAGSLTVDAPVGTPVFVRLSDGAAPITSLPVTLSGAIDTELPTPVSLADDTANPTVPGVGAFLMGWKSDGVEGWSRVRVTAGGELVLGVLHDATSTYGPLNAHTAMLASNMAPSSVSSFGSFMMVFDGATWDRWTGLVSAVQSGAWTVGITGDVTVAELPTAASLADNTANPATTLVGACLMGFDGTTWDRIYTVADGDAISIGTKGFLALGSDGINYQVLTTNSSGQLVVSVTGIVTVGSHAVTNAGTFAVQITGAALTSLQLIDNIVLVGDDFASVNSPGVQFLAYSRTTDGALTADNKWSPLQTDENGFLKVNIKAGAGSGGTALADNAAFTPNTTSFTPVGGEVDDTGTSAATENSAAACRITTQRALHVNLRDASGAELSVGGGTQYDEDTAHASAEKLTMAGVVRKDAATSLVDADGDRTSLIVDASGRLHTIIGNTIAATISGSVDTELPAAAALTDNFANPTAPAVGAFMMVFDGSTWDRFTGAVSATQSGAWTIGQSGTWNVGITGTVAVTNADLASIKTAVELLDDAVFADDAPFTPNTSKALAVAFQADETATDSVDEGDAGVPRITLDRKVIVTTQPHTAGGYTPYSFLSTAAVLTAEIKASAGKIYGIQLFNKGTAAVYVRLYNQTGAPGTGDAANIIFRGIVPGDAAGAGFVYSWPDGLQCATGIGVRVSGAIADNDATVLAANEVMGNVSYK